MFIETFLPQHPVLKKHIAYYYFLKTDDPDFCVRYYSFPNSTTPLNIHKNVRTAIGYYATSVSGCREPNHTLIVQGMRNRPLLACLSGKLDKITIHFKPLGLSRFMKRSFADVAPDDSQLFKEWEDSTLFKPFMTAFFATEDIASRVSVLEAFLLSVYQPLEVAPAFEDAVAQLADPYLESNVTAIALASGIHLRTFDRLFHKHVGCSPVSFRIICRFRHSLYNKIVHADSKSLTDICYESNFYDQSYFINVYHKNAGTSPGAFFDTISKLADNRLIFRFLK